MSKYNARETLIEILKEDPCDNISEEDGCSSCPYVSSLKSSQIDTETEQGFLVEGSCFEPRYADHLLNKGILVPPCKVGDTLYFTGYGAVEELMVIKLTVEVEEEAVFGFVRAIRSYGTCEILGFDEFNNIVFKDKEAAYDSLGSKENS